MQKISYIGDGTTTEFSFNFPYYENTNIVVNKNNTTATGYSIVGTSGGQDADIPYTGGKVVFEIAPTVFDTITIQRQLPLDRVVDYQPTAKINPTVLNQDMNYMMEILKDMQDNLDDFRSRYEQITDQEDVQTLLEKIDAVSEEIENVSTQITNLGDITTIRSNITSLQSSVSDLTTLTGTHTTNISTLDTRTSGLTDYVVASQLPTADNNYTWYRKYKSGWVECGGLQTGSKNIAVGYADNLGIITLPFEMQDTNYYANAHCKEFCMLGDVYKTATTVTLSFLPYQTARTLKTVFWEVRGMSTTE